MPRAVRWLPDAWAMLEQLPENLRKQALAIAGALMADARPDGFETYDLVPDSYRLRSGNVTLMYRVVGDEIDIVVVWPNT